MNYLKEVLAFHSFAAIHRLSPGQKALWHALMTINNKCAWIKWFSAPNQVLMFYSGLSHSGVKKAREALKEHGLIEYRFNGMNATEYTIKSVVLFDPDADSSQKGNQDSSQRGNRSSSQHSSQHSSQDSSRNSNTLNKQNKTKQNKTNYYNTPKSKFNNYVDDNVTDYAELEEQILDMMLEGI